MDPRRRPPYKTIGLVALMVMGLVGVFLYAQFRGDFIPKTKLTMIAPRAGLVTDPSAKVTYNGVQIGRVSSISVITSSPPPQSGSCPAPERARTPPTKQSAIST